MYLIKNCLCGGTEFSVTSKFGIDCATCNKCGIVHQEVAMTESEYVHWYEDAYYRAFYVNRYEQDKVAAQKRLKVYGSLGRSVDVGAGNGAFVDEAVKQGNNIYGVELHPIEGNDRIYVGELHNHSFPTDYFDTITCHDVLEHVISPAVLMKEIFRIANQGGRVIVDFPDFFSEDGKKHWKKIEHLWYLNRIQIVKLINDAGFVGATITVPIPGKFTIVAYKPRQNRTTILVPPGIGDIYWVVVKLRSFMKQHAIELPDVFISSPDGKRRSLDYVQSVPFINAAGYHTHTVTNELQEAYLRDGRTVFNKLMGFDWFIGYNGPMRFGKSLVEIEPQYDCEWQPPVFKPLEYQNYGKEYGRYFIVYLTPHGMYNRWVAYLSPAKAHTIIRDIGARLNAKALVIGSSWDETPYINEIRARGNSVNLVGQTSYYQMMALIRNSVGVFGFPAGNTIMSVVENVPTLLLTEEYFPDAFYKNMCPPLSLENWYKPRSVKLDSETLVNEFVSLCSS